MVLLVRNVNIISTTLNSCFIKLIFFERKKTKTVLIRYVFLRVFFASRLAVEWANKVTINAEYLPDFVDLKWKYLSRVYAQLNSNKNVFIRAELFFPYIHNFFLLCDFQSDDYSFVQLKYFFVLYVYLFFLPKISLHSSPLLSYRPFYTSDFDNGERVATFEFSYNSIYSLKR